MPRFPTAPAVEPAPWDLGSSYMRGRAARREFEAEKAQAAHEVAQDKFKNILDMAGVQQNQQRIDQAAARDRSAKKQQGVENALEVMEEGRRRKQEVRDQEMHDYKINKPYYDPKAGAAGQVKLTERQGKAASWLTTFSGGLMQFEQILDTGYKPDFDSLATFAYSVDEKTGPIQRTAARKLLSEEDLLFFDAAYRVIEPVVRQNTGAAVKASEYIQEFNSLVPFNDSPMEMNSKRMAREMRRRGLLLETLGGYDQVQALPPLGTGNTPTSRLNEGDLGDGFSYTVSE